MFRIRPARPEDEAALYRICLLTGDSGMDASALYTDPRILGHVYAAPYLRHAPDFAFVLEDEEGVAGYVLGVPDTRAFEATLEREWWPPLRAQYPDPAGVPAAEHTWDQKMANLIHRPALADPEIVAAYPAHLHIDLLPRAQGGGNGRRMLDTLFTALRQAGVRGVHLGVGGRNERAQAFYHHLGFQELRRWPSGAVSMGLKL